MKHSEQADKKEGSIAVATAGMLCRDVAFSAWLSRRLKIPIDIRKGDTIEAATAAILRAHLTIDSRSELLTNEGAQDKFMLLVADFRQDTAPEPEDEDGA